jgi:peptide/nickel transport system substrate-binding protein
MGITALRAAAAVLAAVACAAAQRGGELRFSVHTDPTTFDPLMASEDASEAMRYLTAGVLIRFNRGSQKLEPELAVSWKVSPDGRRIDFNLRKDVQFSDGTPFGTGAVVAAIERIASPDVHSGIADTIRSAGGRIHASATGPNSVSVTFSEPVAGLELLFDQVPIEPPHGAHDSRTVLGPFQVAEYKSGQYILLRRNPQYWKRDAGGGRLPYLDSIRLEVLSNREIESVRFNEGQYHMMDRLDPDTFERLRKGRPADARNLGASLDGEFFWFNQAPSAPIPPYKKRWFSSKAFRQAISAAVNRDDIIRLVYHGYAHQALGPVSEANHFWFASSLKRTPYDVQNALRILRQAGFRFDGKLLSDGDGNRVEFSLVTNAGNKARVQIGKMLQQDLAKIGIQLNFTPLEFQSLVERITSTQQYEACLLGLANLDVDPNEQMNVWLSSGTHHPWNPGQAKPATEWEAEIDRLMRAQHASTNAASRKKAFDRVQQIVADEVPIVYLVNPDVLAAVGPSVGGSAPSPLSPHLYWNAEWLFLRTPGQGGRN